MTFTSKSRKVNGKKVKLGSWKWIAHGNAREWAKNKERDYLAGVEKNEGKEGHVYIFSIEFDGLYKVGKTKDIARRLKDLQAGNPSMKVVWSAHVKNMDEAEYRLHNMFSKKRINREIFALTEGDIRHAMNTIQSS